MSRFTDAKFDLLEDGTVCLTSDLIYEVDYLGSGWLVTAEKGFCCDLVSPRWLREFLAKYNWGNSILASMARSAIVHDKLRKDTRRSKFLGDWIFFEALGVDKCYKSVRVTAFILVLLNFSRY